MSDHSHVVLLSVTCTSLIAYYMHNVILIHVPESELWTDAFACIEIDGYALLTITNDIAYCVGGLVI